MLLRVVAGSGHDIKATRECLRWLAPPRCQQTNAGDNEVNNPPSNGIEMIARGSKRCEKRQRCKSRQCEKRADNQENDTEDAARSGVHA